MAVKSSLMMVGDICCLSDSKLTIFFYLVKYFFFFLVEILHVCNRPNPRSGVRRKLGRGLNSGLIFYNLAFFKENLHLAFWET